MGRGFLFADAVYEVITAYNGCALHLEEHLDRLSYSLQQADIECVKSHEEWREIVEGLIARVTPCPQL